MTKREIARKHFPCTCGPMCKSRNMIADDCSFHHEYWDEAMEYYANQERINILKYAQYQSTRNPEQLNKMYLESKEK
jgi:hypothetical protein